MQGKITKTAVDRLEPWSVLWDSEVKGFGVRVIAQTQDIISCAIDLAASRPFARSVATARPSRLTLLARKLDASSV